ncbi:hypothetical protein HUJ05_011571 [Dendroctonus ponderosae]|nr:hypothetical protein HUJ05_011571 [Dendroctonus ponderosae]
MSQGLDFTEGQGEDFERALESTGFGRFHFSLLAVCGLIYLNTAVGITIISFVLPSATCDFQMSSSDKGWLTAAPMFGMVIGSYFWGCLADTKGRKTVLIGALIMDGICGLLSSISQVYWLFMFLRFLNGFAITGAMGICFPYLGEFQPGKYRETILCWMELFWTMGEFENFYPNKKATVCEVSSVVVPRNFTAGHGEFCGDPIADSVFLHTLIIGLACIPTSFWLPLCVHRLGAKFFLVFSLLVAGSVTIGLYFVNSTNSNLALSCIFEALTSLGISTVYCVMVDLFPTNLRVMAAALSLTFGRGGALVGNLLFGFLIDLNCVIPIVLFAAMLFGSGLLCLLLPNTGSGALD